VGISIIDEEHKKFIDIMNKVIVLEQNGSKPKEIRDVLNEMIKYANTHFATEEAYMVKFDYADYENHRKGHQGFFIETMVYLDRITNSNRQLICEILEHLKSWLVNHIQSTDTKYISCFKEHRLK
jgi:hemerythrin